MGTVKLKNNLDDWCIFNGTWKRSYGTNGIEKGIKNFRGCTYVYIFKLDIYFDILNFGNNRV